MIIWFSLVIALVINFVLFLIAFNRQSDKLTDFAYALSFMIVALTALTVSAHRSLAAIIAVVLVFAWGLRLGSYLVMRIRKVGHDKRFDELRGSFFDFLKFWLGQGFVAWLLLLPVLFMLSHNSKITGLLIFGVIVWLVGFIIEIFADNQKFQFIQNPVNKGKWIDKGLWHYSRHPNYFGEITIWAGMYLVAFSAMGPIGRLIGMVSPIAIFITLRFISGVPILEKGADKRWGHDAAYKKYKKVTPLLVPKWRASNAKTTP